MRDFHLTFTGIFLCIQRTCPCDTNISLLKSMIWQMTRISYWLQGQCGEFRQIQEFWFTAGKNAEWGWHSWWGSWDGRQQSVGSKSAMSIDSQVCKLLLSLSLLFLISYFNYFSFLIPTPPHCISNLYSLIQTRDANLRKSQTNSLPQGCEDLRQAVGLKHLQCGQPCNSAFHCTVYCLSQCVCRIVYLVLICLYVKRIFRHHLSFLEYWLCIAMCTSPVTLSSLGCLTSKRSACNSSSSCFVLWSHWGCHTALALLSIMIDTHINYWWRRNETMDISEQFGPTEVSCCYFRWLNSNDLAFFAQLMDLEEPVEDNKGFVYEKDAIHAHIRRAGGTGVQCPVAGINSFSALISSLQHCVIPNLM